MSIPPNSAPVKARRHYDSRLRRAQAAQTRQALVAAALDLFLDQGYAETTIAAIAKAAGVAVETIYRAFGRGVQAGRRRTCCGGSTRWPSTSVWSFNAGGRLSATATGSRQPTRRRSLPAERSQSRAGPLNVAGSERVAGSACDRAARPNSGSFAQPPS